MSKVQMLVVILTALVLLAESSYPVQARPGPLELFPSEGLISLSRQLLSTGPIGSDPEPVNLSNRDADELDSEEELDAVCIENETCEEKRLLTASIDYRTEGPNNPITDPPH